jgi:allantoicase
LDRAYTIVAVEVDTAHFTGNHVPQISLQATNLTEEEASDLITKLPHAITRLVQGKGRQGVGCSADQVARAHEACGDWNEILPRTPLKPGYEETRMHYFTLSMPTEATHVRLNAHPDGGFARLKLWVLPQEESKNPPLYMPITTCQTVTVVPHSSTDKPPSRLPYDYPELSSEQLGGEGVACSNQHYGHPSQLLQSNLGKDMGDGWETARHPDRPAVWVKDEETHLLVSDLSDWAIIKLGKIVADGISRIILDTKHFRGNFPESVLVEGCFVEAGMTVESVKDWFVVVPRTKMAPDAEHVFDEHQIQNATRAVSHVRVTIFPDGGLSRVRVYGKPLEDHLLSHL